MKLVSEYKLDNCIEHVCLNDIDRNNSLYYLSIKRIIDIIVSTIGIISLLPLFIVVAVVIKLESNGPIIYKQLRVGKDNKLFYIYKFRSMKEGSPIIASEEFQDSYRYITRIGRFIRKSNIDELPQLFNVLKGDMSLVGPRPVIEIEERLINLRTSYGVDKMLPGITGWAQVKSRNEIDFEKKANYDLYYLSNRSIKLDLYIILKTLIRII